MEDLISSTSAFCINLDRRLDRWNSFRKSSDSVGWRVSRVSAVERLVDSKVMMSGPEACIRSHREAWKLALSASCPMVAIFEDDAMFPSDFAYLFGEAFSELPEDWRIWHLHSLGPIQTIEPIGKYITRLKRCGWGSHGYLIKREFAKDLLDLSDHVKNMPVDVLLTVGMRYLGVIPYGVALEKTLCIQSALDSDIPESDQSRYWTKVRDMYMR